MNCKEHIAMANEDKMIANKAPNRKKLEALLIALPRGLVSFPGVVISSPGFFLIERNFLII